MSNRSNDAIHVIPTKDPYNRVRPVNPDDISKSFFKTRLCPRLHAGTCPYNASSCHFAHSVEELRSRRSNPQETATKIHKGILCKQSQSRQGCPQGESCMFLHDETSRNRETVATSLSTRGYGANDAQIVKPADWKTKICYKWKITGNCPYGLNCKFAHGASNLQRFGGTLTASETKQTGQGPAIDTQIPKWKGPTATNALEDSDVFPTVTMPITVGVTGMLLFVIFAGFFSLFFWRCLLNRLFSAWTLQRTPYGDLIHVATPPENTGLDPIIIRSFPVFLYSSAKMKNHGAECAICLSEFSDEDTVRLIRVCGHGFHTNCIDLWFELHKTCPVCRCELDPGLVGSGSPLQNTVTITIQDINHEEDHNNPPTMEATAWRFSRSNSTGHFTVKTTDINVKIKRKHYQTETFEDSLPTTSSSKRQMEPSNWRISRSHSTGHFMVKTTDINVKMDGRHYQTGSCAMFDEFTRYGEAAEYGMA